ncbi:MAG: aromatic-ring-hydroxylating dioxygenase subunit beta [Dongiaceae bacterium]
MDIRDVISRAQADYARCIDDGRLEEWPDFFEADCLYRITTIDNLREGHEAGIIYADSRTMLEDRVAALRAANIYEQQRYRHILGMPVILSADEEKREIGSETAFLVIRILHRGASDIFATGRYLDRYRLAGERASLRERIVVCDSSRIDTSLALPI